MNQHASNIAMSEMENELDKVIGEIADAAKAPLITPAPPRSEDANPAPFKTSFPGLGGRPLTEAERRPIPPQNPAPQPAPVASDRAVAIGSAESFLATGEKLLEVQRKKIQDLESKHEIDRVKLIDDYRVRLRDLEHQASEALRSFDIAHQAAHADAKRILDALVAMRG